jgi:hypothetical protein
MARMFSNAPVFFMRRVNIDAAGGNSLNSQWFCSKDIP